MTPDEKPPIMSADEAFNQDEEWGFKVGEQDEFDMAEDHAQQLRNEEDTAEVPAFTKEIDFGDGEIVTIEANDQDELIQKIIDAQNERVTKMMLNPQQEPYRQRPPVPKRYDPPTPPTTDEIGEVMLRLNSDPYSAVDKMVQWSIAQNLGMPIEAVQERLAAADNIVTNQYHFQVGQDFVRRHMKFDQFGDPVSGDYYPCPENTQRMLRLLEVEGRDVSPENYEYAFSKLRAANGLINFPKGYFDDVESQPVNQASTALSGRQSAYPVPGVAGLEDDELIRRAGQMSTSQLEAEINKRKYALRGPRR